MHSFDITLDEITKIEGQAGLEVKVTDGIVEKVQLKISEGKRFFQEAAIGKKYHELPQLFSRICGTCSPAHLLCSIEAIEHAFDIQPSKQTIDLRKLLLNGTILRDHGMHLYYFCLPDIFNKESILEFEGELHKWIHDSMSVRNTGVKLCELVAGRSIHPLYATVGGFTKTPKKNELKQITLLLESIREKALQLCAVFEKPLREIENETDFVALSTGDFSFIEGKIITSKGETIEEQNYEKHLDEFVIPYSNAEEFEFEGKNYTVGAVSRINLNMAELNQRTKKDCSDYLKHFPSNNPFENNLAQAIEIVQCIDNSIEIIENFEEKTEETKTIEAIESRGIGVIEAPRGTLYYALRFNERGICERAEVIIPTAQNSKSIEKSIKTLLPSLLELEKPEIESELEKTIRAFDPCMSCATHFLKVNWQ